MLVKKNGVLCVLGRENGLSFVGVGVSPCVGGLEQLPALG